MVTELPPYPKREDYQTEAQFLRAEQSWHRRKAQLEAGTGTIKLLHDPETGQARPPVGTQEAWEMARRRNWIARNWPWLVAAGGIGLAALTAGG